VVHFFLGLEEILELVQQRKDGNQTIIRSWPGEQDLDLDSSNELKATIMK
jgi:hypothetical protein